MNEAKKVDDEALDLILPAVQQLPPYVPGATEEMIRRQWQLPATAQLTKLSQNESALGPSAAVLQAVQQGIELGRYPDADQLTLRTQLAARWGVASDEVVIGNGSSELIALACRAFVDRGGHAVIGDPSFACYALYLQAAAVPYTAVPLRQSLHWQVDALLAAVTAETKLLFIDNPNNPTGDCLPPAELKRLLVQLPAQVLAVIDEAYGEYATGDGFASVSALRSLHPRCLMLRTFSKAYGLAALRIGYAIGPRACIDALRRLRLPFSINGFAQVAALAALADEAHLRRTVELNDEERARVTAAARALGYRVAPSQANFVLLHAGMPSPQAYEQLAQRGVIVRQMGGVLDGWLRCTLGLPRENDALLASLEELRQSVGNVVT